MDRSNFVIEQITVFIVLYVKGSHIQTNIIECLRKMRAPNEQLTHPRHVLAFVRVKKLWDFDRNLIGRRLCLLLNPTRGKLKVLVDPHAGLVSVD